MFASAVIGETKTINIINKSTKKSFTVDIDQKLNKLRDILVEDGFIYDDRPLNKWRFVIPSNANTVLVSEDEIVGKQSERFMIIKECLYNENEIRITNVDAKPDLNGIETDLFTDRSIEISVALSDEVLQEKFQPLMLRHVRKFNNTYSSYDHVVVCEENSAIEFKITGKGFNIFGYSIKPDQGEYIVEALYPLNRYGKSDVNGVLRRYQHKQQNIKVVSAETPDIPLSEAAKLQHITFTAWKVHSFREAENDGMNSVRIPSGGYNKARFVPGDRSDDRFGKIYDVVEDRSNILGRIEIDFFIFKSKEAAQKVFDSRH